MNSWVDIAALHQSIRAGIEVQFPGVFVDFYPRPGEKIKVPAILLELEDITVSNTDDMGTEQCPVTLNFNAYCVLSYKSGNKIALRTMAAALLYFIRGERWGMPVSAADVSGVSPDSLSGDNHEYEVMRVEFSHEAILGNDAWAGDGQLPTTVYLGASPDVGPDHLTDYEQIIP